MSERRRWTRYKVGWPFFVKRAGEKFEFEGVLRDISACGLFGYTGTSLAPGMTVEVSIRFPLGQGSWMRYAAEVIRVETEATESGIALKLESPRPLLLSDVVSK